MIQVHDSRLPGGMLEVDTDDPAKASAAAKKYLATNAAPPPPDQPNSAVDAARSVPGGLAKGVAGVVGLPSSAMNFVANQAGRLVGREQIPDSDPRAARFMGLPTVSQAEETLGGPTGGYYKPQTAAGRYAETIASFAPAALSPGSTAARAGRVLLPAAASQTAGEFTAGTDLEPYARVAGAVAGGVAAGPAIRSINALTSRVGVPIENPQTAAHGMLADAVRRDGGTEAVTANLDSWRGNSDPALIDVTGNNVRRLVRSAASGGAGEAQGVATTYADRIAGNLQDHSLALTRRLTPVNNSATNYGELLTNLQNEDAQFNYKGPYSEPATVTPEMVSALQGPEGRSAIGRAYAAARANRDPKAMAELQDLQGVASEQGGGANPITGQRRSVQQALGELSSGSLDRVRIAMREIGGNLAARGARDMARGYRGRVTDIDTALDQTPGLGEARASYANYGRQQDALELGQTGLNASPDDYVAQVTDLARRSPPTASSPGALAAVGVGHRQALTDAISRPAEGQTGVLNRIATSTAQTRNMGASFGQGAAADYQTGIGNEIDRVRNSRFISPNTGSQTELRMQDASLLDIPTSKLGMIKGVLDKIKSGAQLTEQERTELVRLGTTEARLVELQRANPSMTSRALTSAALGNNRRQ